MNETHSILTDFFALAADSTDFRRFIGQAKLLNASPGRVLVEIEVVSDMVDDSNKVATGCLFTIFDNLCMATAFSKFPAMISSVSAQVHYFHQPSLGDVLCIDTKVLQTVGSQLYIESTIVSKTNNQLVAKGGQTMAYVGDPPMKVNEEDEISKL